MWGRAGGHSGNRRRRRRWRRRPGDGGNGGAGDGDDGGDGGTETKTCGSGARHIPKDACHVAEVVGLRRGLAEALGACGPSRVAEVVGLRRGLAEAFEACGPGSVEEVVQHAYIATPPGIPPCE